MVDSIGSYGSASFSLSDQLALDPIEIAARLADAIVANTPSDSNDVTQTEFQQAFDSLDLPPQVKALGADAIFATLDPENTGRVGKSDLIGGLAALATRAPGGPARGDHAGVERDDDQLPSAWSVISQSLASR